MEAVAVPYVVSSDDEDETPRQRPNVTIGRGIADVMRSRKAAATRRVGVDDRDNNPDRCDSPRRSVSGSVPRSPRSGSNTPSSQPASPRGSKVSRSRSRSHGRTVQSSDSLAESLNNCARIMYGRHANCMYTFDEHGVPHPKTLF